jgi:DNA (cytosine-5)-methyltransferase 1
MFTVLDLFSGIGGFSLGLERTGQFKTVAFCEIDPFCQKVLTKHWPTVPIHSDIKKLNACELPSNIDVICGGFPCQDISLAGTGEGLDGLRSGLWKEYARIIREVQPKYVIMENVAALLVRGVDRILGDLAKIGYDAEWDCFPTGLPFGHRRNRFWIVAYPCGSRLSNRSASRKNDAFAKKFFSGGRFTKLFTHTFPKEKWADRPLLGRGIPRVPNRMDRVRSLGNSINPQVAEYIGKAIISLGVENR